MKRLDLTDEQQAALLGVLRERAELCKAQRAELIASGGTQGLVRMADAALQSLTELYLLVELAKEIEPRAALLETVDRLRRAGGLPADEDAERMLQRALGVGPVDCDDDEHAMKAALAVAAGEPIPPFRVRLPWPDERPALAPMNRAPLVRPIPCRRCGSAAAHGEGRYEYCSGCGAELGARYVPDGDDSGATGTQRSDWGERGEGSEEP